MLMILSNAVILQLLAAYLTEKLLVFSACQALYALAVYGTRTTPGCVAILSRITDAAKLD